MAENQDNPLPPAIPAELANQNPAPHTMYDYAKPNFTGTESSIYENPNTHLMDLETLYDAWERFKDPLRRCPHHGLPLWLQVQTFYNGVNPSTRQMIDAAASGTINSKTPKEASEFIEEMSLNNYQWQVMRTKLTKTTGIYNVDSVHPAMRYDSNGRGVPIEYPPFNPTIKEEQVNYMVKEIKDHRILRVSNSHLINRKRSRVLRRYYPNSSQCQKLVSRIPRHLPSNTEPNPREQLNAIDVQEGCVETEPEPRQENVESKGNGENKLPNKLKDPGSFTVPCLIGSLDVNNALADLRASINVKPYNMFKQLGLGKPKQTRMSIQLADKTIRFPRGIIEDVLVKVDKFIFPVDFIILDIEEDISTLLILGRPFLVTAKAIIDVGIGELTLSVGDETITLQARNSSITSNMEGNDPHHPTKTDNMTQSTL
ncbi:hypothetical protein CXB51_014616 [Gossypium anomalum]|uniref:Retrotransposon gag domain-containing protein n=1 Tax=Gossypium anomalum TaxID=47600 RepID=A0A8J5ZAD0_9ROSI|nr:hypothetical protein CXB51_014616 [Gossypium anomalum]